MVASLLKILAITAAALVAAAVQARRLDFPWVPAAQQVKVEQQVRGQSSALRERHGVDLERFQQLMSEGAIVIDARPASEFAKAHVAAPPAALVLNVPGGEADEHVERLLPLTGYRFVIYCTSLTCDLAEQVLVAMLDYGFNPDDLYLYPPGWQDGIVPNGLPTASGPDAWTPADWGMGGMGDAGMDATGDDPNALLGGDADQP